MISGSDVTFVVQGPIRDETGDCLRSIRRVCPRSPIILSTWRGQRLQGLDYDLLVENDDPGQLNVRDGDQIIAKENTNRQIVSTLGGLRRVETRHAVKFRSDNILLGAPFLAVRDRFRRRDSAWSFLDERVVISSINTIDPRSFLGYVFQFSDWFYFGTKADLLHIWDRPLIPDDPWLLDESRLEERRCRGGFHFGRFSAEQHISLGFVAKNLRLRCGHYRDRTVANVEATERVLASNFIVAEPSLIGFHFPKYSSFCRPDWRSPRSLKQYIGFKSTTVGFSRWRQLYQNHVLAIRDAGRRPWHLHLPSLLLYGKSYTRRAT